MFGSNLHVASTLNDENLGLIGAVDESIELDLANNVAADEISIEDVSITEGNSGTSNATVTLSLSNASGGNVSVDFSTTNGTAVAPNDYITTTGTVTFTGGTTSQTITIPIAGDLIDEVDENLFVNLSNASGGATIADDQATVTIIDNDPTRISINNVTVVEGDISTQATVIVRLSNPSSDTITVNYSTAPDTAITPDDYTTTTGTLTFAPGETRKTLTVDIAGDTIDELSERFFVNLDTPTNATIVDNQGIVTITDNDPAPRITVDSISVTEGDSGTNSGLVTVSLIGSSSQTVTVDYTTASNSATTPNDYQTTAGTLVFAPGETSKTIPVQVVGDTIDEANENFFVNLTNPSNATIQTSQSIVTITDNDALPRISIGDVTIVEGTGGTAIAQVQVSLLEASGRNVSVAYNTSDGTATAGADYTSTTGTIDFAAGETSKEIVIEIAADTIDEPDETFFVNLNTPTNATILDNQATVTLQDNDPTPNITIEDVTVSEASGSATVTVNLSNARSVPITVDYATENNTAVAPNDYTATTNTLTFAPGQTSQTITVAIADDAIDEINERFFVNLSNANNANITDNRGIVTITDNDPFPTISINDLTVTEGTGGTPQALVTVNLSGESGKTVTVNYRTENGTAVQGSDYTNSIGTLSFAAGTTSQTIAIPLVGDSIDEVNENFFVNLSTVTNATIADNQAEVTISDDDNPPTISISDVTVTETNVGATQATVTVNLSNGSTQAISVDYATANGSAVAPNDYTSTSGTINFAPGETSQTITVPIVGDTIDEANESFFVNLSNPNNTTISDNQGSVTITDNDPTPSITIEDLTVTEANFGTTTAEVTVNLSNARSIPITVNYATANDTAVAPDDYTSTTGTLTFAAGVTSQTITLAIVGDTIDEINESFFVNLSGANNATIADNQGVVTINDTDPTPSITVSDVTVAEGDGTAQVTVSLSNASSQGITVGFTTANDSAVAPGDYTTTTGTLSFAAGQTSQTITVPIVGDTIDETDESFFVNLSSATNATIEDNQAVVTITDDDTASISISDVTVTEGNSGTTNATVTVSLSNVISQPVSVAFTTANNTATAPGDYTTTTGTVSFAAGVTSQTITVPVVGDTIDEINESFFVNLSSANNAVIADNQGVVTITDNDPTPSISISDVTVTEGNVGATTAEVTVSLSNARSVPITVDYATANGSAVAPGDYTADSGTLTFAAGQTSQTITVPIVGDTIDEADESFFVNLSNASNATITDNQATVTITDNDNAPGISISDVTVIEGDTGTTSATVTVSLSNPSSQAVSVGFATANDTATAPGDYTATSGTLNFAAGVTSQTITVPIVGDTVNETNESFFVNLSSPTNATITDNQGVVSIADNDSAPNIVISDVTVTEGNSGTSNATVTVSLSNSSTQAVSVGFATANATATAPSDYTATTGTLNFAAGVTSQTITVPIVGDTIDEVDERFFVNLSGANNATIADNQGIVTITDNDTSSVTISDVTVTEGDSGTSNATLTVSLSNANSQAVTVGYSTANDSAVAPGDYTATTGTLNFAAGVTSQTITVPVVGDTIDEVDERFFVNLNSSTNATIADNQGIVTIADNDGAPSISIADVTVTEGNVGATQATVTVSLSAASSQTVTVGFATANGTGTAPNDYTTTTGTLSFAAGTTSQTITIPVVGDTIDELNENFFVNLSSPTNATIADNQATVTITDNDNSPGISISDVTVIEGDTGTTSATVTVSLSNPSSQAVSVGFATANDTATAPGDYTATSGTLNFAAGVTSQTITVPIVGDTVNETNESFFVNLSSPTNATITDNQGVVSIADNDSAPNIVISDVTVTEGNSGTSNATVTVSLSNSSTQAVSVGFATANATATAPSDYTATTGTLNFAAGVTSQTITVPIVGDTIDEVDERFFVNLSGANNATIADNQGIVTITDNDTSSVTISDVTVTEGDSGTSNATLTVSLSNANSQAVTVGYSTANDSAVAPGDYTATSGTLNFAAGVTSQTITVPVVGDTIDEVDERFFVNLNSSTNATIADNQGIVTIADNDGAPSISIADVTVTEGNVGATQATVTVSLSAASSQTVTVGFATANGTGTAPNDYTTTTGTLSFAAGTTSQTITIPVVGDTIDELNENFFVNLSSPTNATIADNQATVTITDNDNSPGISISDVTVIEGDTGTTSATVTVSLSNPSSQAVSVGFATANDTATAPGDYTATSGTLNFAAGVTSQTITVPIVGDTVNETNESFFVNLSGANNATITDNQGVVTIADNDSTPNIVISDVTVTEGNTGTSNATVTVSLSNNSTQAVSVGFATANGTATAPGDYTATTGTLNFAAGVTSQTITVPIVGDTIDELNENFFVNLSGANNATIADNQGIVTITDNDTSSVTISDVTVTEGDSGTSNATLTVSLSNANSQAVTVGYSTANDSAVAPGDYTATSGTLNFAAGVTSQTITVPVVGDTIDELNERFFVNLNSSTNATIADNQGVVTITDNDGAPSISIADVTVTEGNVGATQATVTVSLSAASSQAVTVGYATANNTAVAPGDYTATSGTLSFAAGTTSQTITIPVVGDTIDELNENFFVNLSSPTNATIADNQATVTITDNDNAPGITISDVTVTEGNSGTSNAIVTVNLSNASGQAVSVGFATANGTASSPSDYTTTTGTLSFAAGVTSQTITIPIVGDTVDENNETFFVNLSSATNATITDNQAVVTITDDDATPVTPSITISDVTVTEGNTGTSNATVTVNLSNSSSQAVSVAYTTANNTATAPADYTTNSGTLNFAAGVTSQTITVPIVGDTIDELNENFFVNLSSPTNATIADNQGSVTITDNDTSSINISDVTVTEGNSGTTNATVTLSLSNANSQVVSVGFATANGTAVAPDDYTATSGTVSFAAGTTSQTITIPIVGDTIDELNENFFVNLSSPTNATIADNQATVTITDNNSASISISDVTVTEGNTGTSNATVTVNLSNASSRSVSVAYATQNGSAVAPGDYTTTSGTLNFAAGVTSQTITVPIVGDTIDELNENFFVNLSSATNATIADNQATVTITDNDNPPRISIANVSVNEGNSGLNPATVTVTLSNASSRSVTVNYATAPDTATAPSDYRTATGTLTFAPGQTSQNIEIDIVGDTTFETNERFFVNLDTPTNATIADNQAIVNIINDEANANPTISINDVNLVEGNTDSANAIFLVSLNSSSTVPVTVTYTTVAQSATAGSDFTAKTGQITFTPGETQKNISIPIINNNVNEPDETFEVVLSAPQNGIILDGVGVANISDTLVSSVTPILPPAVENLTLSGTDNISGTGNTGNNIITGNSGNNNLNGAGGNDSLVGENGNDTLDGGAGNDTLVGGAGNDTYIITTATADVVNETVTTAGQIDTVQSSVTYTLGNNIENLLLTGTSAINGTGNSLNNSITGNTSANRLVGNAGNDTLSGNAGNDTLTGSQGNDQFSFNTDRAFNTTDLGIDTITDFTRPEDKIVLSKVTFTAVTSAAGVGFSNDGEFATVNTDAAAATSSADIVYNTANGKLFYNQNGTATGLGTGAQFATLTGNPALAANDFLIIP